VLKSTTFTLSGEPTPLVGLFEDRELAQPRDFVVLDTKEDFARRENTEDSDLDLPALKNAVHEVEEQAAQPGHRGRVQPHRRRLGSGQGGQQSSRLLWRYHLREFDDSGLVLHGIAVVCRRCTVVLFCTSACDWNRILRSQFYPDARLYTVFNYEDDTNSRNQ